LTDSFRGSTTRDFTDLGIDVLDQSIKQVPSIYRKVEDLWLSYVVHQLGWRVRRIIMADVNFMEDVKLDRNASSTMLVQSTALWKDQISFKLKMLEELRSCGWNV
jgi:hypothetical protein